MARRCARAVKRRSVIAPGEQRSSSLPAEAVLGGGPSDRPLLSGCVEGVVEHAHVTWTRRHHLGARARMVRNYEDEEFLNE